MSIPQEFIDEVKHSVDIVDIISGYIDVEDFKACCPFHDEKTPSFRIHQGDQFYHCFGCDAQGDVFKFITEHTNSTFFEAVSDMASLSGIELPQLDDNSKQMAEYTSNKSQAVRAHKKLYTSQLAAAHFKSRNITGKTAKTFMLGYNSNDQLVFPVLNPQGKVSGFSYRNMSGAGPKYINSKASCTFDKSRTLYGLYELLQSVKKPESIIVFEGQIDVLTAHQAGIQNVVGTLGTAMTDKHFQELFKRTNHVILCFDADTAGQKAMIKAIKNGLSQLKGLRNISVVRLPDGKDPDDLIKENQNEFLDLLSKHTTIYDTMIEGFSKQVNMDTFEGPSHLIHLALPFLKEITDRVTKERFMNKLCEISDLEYKQLDKALC